ncbi:MAG TPA: divalent-cation tolerance protein CutA [Pyrinomonadaceae bacterium]
MKNQSADPIIVFITAASAEEAMRIAEVLVDSRLAACVQVLPEMHSIYLWKGEVERAREVLMIAKTTMAQFEGLQNRVCAIHSYETPEIIALPIVAASEDYLRWLTSSLEGS